MKVAIFQNASVIGEPTRQLEALARCATNLSGRADVLVCPELFLSGYNIGESAARAFAERSDGSFAQAAARIAAQCGLAIIYGFPERTGDRLYNAALCIDAGGNTIARHRKLYLPNDYERSVFSPGDEITVFQLNDMKVGLLVCYDLEFPEAVRACALRGAELVTVPTALNSKWAWLADSLVRTRAFENGIFLAYANHAGTEGDWTYCGLSCIVGPDGQDLARAGSSEQVISAELDRSSLIAARTTLPYLKDLRPNIS